MHEDKIPGLFRYGNRTNFICPQTETELVQLFVMFIWVELEEFAYKQRPPQA